MSDAIRVQIVSERNLIAALKDNASRSVQFEDYELPAGDQNFGLVEAAAVVALATSVANLVDIIVKIYKSINDETIEVTLKTPKGTVTVRGSSADRVDALLKQLKSVT